MSIKSTISFVSNAGCTLTCALFLHGSPSFAQENGAASIKIGETDLTPSVTLGYNSDSNVFRTIEGQEQDATSVSVAPEVMWVADKSRVRLVAQYNGNYQDSSQSAFDIADHALGLGTKLNISSRHRLDANLNFSIINQDLGTGISRRLPAEVDELVKYNENRIGLQYTFGAIGAAGNIRAGFNFRSLSYQNQEAITDGADEDVTAPFVEFSYRVAPDTRLSLQLRQAAFDFESPRSDRTDTTVLVGISFNASSVFNGRVAVGNTRSTLDVGETSNDSTLAFDTELEYNPTSFARFKFSFDREIDGNSSGLGSSVDPVIITDLIKLGWRHDWNTRFYTDAALQRLKEDRDCPEITTNTDTISLVAGYAFRRWITFGLNLSTSNRSFENCPAEDPIVNTLTRPEFDTTRAGIFTKITL